MSKQRIGYIDVAKCIAMAFIVIGHTGLVFSAHEFAGGMPSVIIRLAFTFHLPVFFILSGFLTPETRGPSAAGVRKDLQRLILPYAVTCILIVATCTVLAHAHGLSTRGEFVRWAEASLWGAGARSNVALWDVERIGGIWFFLALFWARLLVFSTYRINPWHRLLVLSSCTAIAAITARFVWLPLSLQSGVGCALLLYLGMLARKVDAFDAIKPSVLFFCLVVWAYVVVHGGGMSLAMQVYPLGVVDVIGGVAATVCIIFLSQEIDAHAARLSYIMQLVGRNTLPILCMHIVEDNCLRWAIVGTRINSLIGTPFVWVILCIVRFAFVGILVMAVSMLPGLRQAYFQRQ